LDLNKFKTENCLLFSLQRLNTYWTLSLLHTCVWIAE